MFVIKQRKNDGSFVGQWVECYSTHDGSDCSHYLRQLVTDARAGFEYKMEYVKGRK